jgi:regulator of sigma E protease
MIETLQAIAYNTLPFLGVLTILVFVHELGHYYFARRYGVGVVAFAIGFGPELFGWTDKHGTRWRLCAIPLGGYLQMYGDLDAASARKSSTDDLPDAEKNKCQAAKTVGQRAWIAFGGPLFNFIFAIVALSGLYMTAGKMHQQAVVGGVAPNSPAAIAGLEPGDQITSIDSQAIKDWNQMVTAIQAIKDREVTIVVNRQDKNTELSITPQKSKNGDDYYRIGVQAGFSGVRHRLSAIQSIKYAFVDSYNIGTSMLSSIGQIIVGKSSTKNLGGPLKIAQVSGQVAQHGIGALIGFMVMLSISLGLLNLFPIPALDGGHLTLYALEAIRGRPLSEKAEHIMATIGFTLLMALILLVTWQDLMALKVVQSVLSLIGF